MMGVNESAAEFVGAIGAARDGRAQIEAADLVEANRIFWEKRRHRATFAIHQENLDAVFHGRIQLPESYVVIGFDYDHRRFSHIVTVCSPDLPAVEIAAEAPMIDTVMKLDDDGKVVVIVPELGRKP